MHFFKNGLPEQKHLQNFRQIKSRKTDFRLIKNYEDTGYLQSPKRKHLIANTII